LLKARGETVLDRMHRIFVAIWETGEWPEEYAYDTILYNIILKTAVYPLC